MRKRTFAFALLFTLAMLSAACPQSGRSASSAGSKAQPAATSSVAKQAGVPVSEAPAGAKAERISTSDGWQLAAWYWPPKDGIANAPGVLMLHQRGSNKASWGNLAAKLVAEGYAVLAIDLRGHGETLNPEGQHVELARLHQADYQAMLNDVAAACTYISQQPGVNGERLAIIGASIGANLAIMYASTDYRVRTAVCLSPGLDYFGLKPLDYLPGYDRRALYLIATTGDKYSFDSCVQIAASTLADPVSFRKFEGKAHGTELLAVQSGLADTIVSGWLLNHVPPAR